jgi:DNA invertase Pin-like site-specific DNA recombinase
MKVAIYARVSTDDQTTEMQLRDLQEYAAARKFEIYKIYEDLGISGSVKSRPSLDQMMDDAKKRKFQAVLVWRFDRFARSTKHLILALEEFKEYGIDFISYNENIDTSSALGEMIFTIISGMAQMERRMIKERVMAGLKNARAKGKRLGRPIKVREEMVRVLSQQGNSHRQIAAQLGISSASVHRALKKAL